MHSCITKTLRCWNNWKEHYRRLDSENVTSLNWFICWMRCLWKKSRFFFMTDKTMGFLSLLVPSGREVPISPPRSGGRTGAMSLVAPPWGEDWKVIGSSSTAARKAGPPALSYPLRLHGGSGDARFLFNIKFHRSCKKNSLATCGTKSNGHAHFATATEIMASPQKYVCG